MLRDRDWAHAAKHPSSSRAWSSKHPTCRSMNENPCRRRRPRMRARARRHRHIIMMYPQALDCRHYYLNLGGQRTCDDGVMPMPKKYRNTSRDCSTTPGGWTISLYNQGVIQRFAALFETLKRSKAATDAKAAACQMYLRILPSRLGIPATPFEGLSSVCDGS